MVLENVIIYKALVVLPVNITFAVILTLCTLSGYGYYLYGHSYEFKNILFALSFIDNIAVTSLTFSNLAIIISSYYHRIQFQCLMKDIKTFERNVTCTTTCAIFKITFVVLNFSIILTLIIDGLTCTSIFGWSLYKFHIPKAFQFYHLSLWIYFIYFLAYELKSRFTVLNEMLENSVCQEKSSNLSKTIKSQLNYMNCLQKYYNDLYKIVDQYNSIFGLTFLFFILFTIIIILEYVSLVIYFTMFLKVETIYYYILTSICWVFIMMVSIVFSY